MVASDWGQSLSKPFKVFGIGFNRTGTSSLRIALRKLGYRTAVKNAPFMKLYKRGKIGRLMAATHEWDAFRDWPWPMLYRQALETHGEDARFVLTRRASASAWIESLKRHSEVTNPDRHQRTLMLGYDYPHGYESEHAALYENHLIDVRRFFGERGKAHLLCELCWDEGQGWPELCSFLREPVPDAGFPWANTSRDARGDPEFIARNRAKIARQVATADACANLAP
ncbi:MAG: sulfotransferase [Paracoccaceae bacterium]